MHGWRPGARGGVGEEVHGRVVDEVQTRRKRRHRQLGAHGGIDDQVCLLGTTTSWPTVEGRIKFEEDDEIEGA